MDFQLKYRLVEEDLVQFFLYYSENSEFQQRRLRRQRIMIPLMYLGIAGFFLVLRQYLMTACFGVFAAGWYCLWPAWARRRYRKFYQGHVKELGDDHFRNPVVLTLTNEGIHSASDLAEATYRFAAIDRIAEDVNHTYIFVQKGQGLVLPHDRLPKEERDRFIMEFRRRWEATMPK